MVITEKIRETFPKLRNSEQKVASYMLEHKQQVANMSLDRLAKEAGVSQPSVIRMLNAVGYKGFKEAKIAFVEECTTQSAQGYTNVFGVRLSKADKVEDVPGIIIGNTMQLLQDSLSSISAKSIKKAVEAIEAADSVCIFSVENSNAIASDLMTKLIYLGVNCEFMQDYYLQNVRAGHMKKGNVAVGISYTGTSKNTVEVLKRAKKNGVTTIAITNFDDTPLVKYADIVILTSNKQLLYGNDIFSRTVHLAVVDMIYMGLVLNNYEKYQSKLSISGEMIKTQKIK